MVLVDVPMRNVAGKKKKLPPAHASGSPNGMLFFLDLKRQGVRQASNLIVFLLM